MPAAAVRLLSPVTVRVLALLVVIAAVVAVLVGSDPASRATRPNAECGYALTTSGGYPHWIWTCWPVGGGGGGSW